jgi:hypothetical protein
MKKVIGLILCVFHVILFSAMVHAYDEKIVHPKINEKAVEQSSLGEVLEKLGYSTKLETFFNGYQPIYWLSQGGTDEDYLTRLLRHFHDPLEPWADAGSLALDSN